MTATTAIQAFATLAGSAALAIILHEWLAHWPRIVRLWRARNQHKDL